MKTNAASVLFGTNQAMLAGVGQNNTQASQNAEMSFADTLNSTAGKSGEMNLDNKASQSTQVAGNKPVKEVTESKQQPERESLDKNEEMSAVKEITEDVKKIVSEIKEKFDVTDEDIEEAMEMLGMTYADLFNQVDLRNLLMTVTKTEDSVMLLTDVDLYEGMNDLVDMMNDLKNEIVSEYGITDEAFQNIVTDEKLFEEVSDEVMGLKPVNTEAENKATDDTEKNIIETIANADVTVNELSMTANMDDESEVVKAEPVKISDDTKNQADVVNAPNIQDDKKEIKVEVNVEKTEAPVTDEAIKKIVTDTENKSDNNAKEDNHNEQHSEFFTVVNEVTSNTVADVVEVVESYSNVADTENIMRQVTEFVKVNITANSTSMEMQLHPASLGTVNMQVISQNGQITAQFTVQNEAVKAVLENQLLTLQETLNEAGTKVSAIEVTVANYNLDKGAEGNTPENNKENGQKSSKRRNIDLSSLDSLDDLDDEELMEAKVMEMNGNTVSYTV